MSWCGVVFGGLGGLIVAWVGWRSHFGCAVVLGWRRCLRVCSVVLGSDIRYCGLGFWWCGVGL